MALSDYEDTLKSYILDDDKLVTYKWLSKEFEVHVNVAKDLLKQYWIKNKDEEKLIATFLLVGQLKDGSIRIEVVKEGNLSTARSKFAKINCEHLYSLQKFLDDIELLALTEDGDLRFSAIKCNEEYLRSNEEIERLRYVGNAKKEENKTVKKVVDNKVPEKQVTKKIDSSSKEKTNNLMKYKADEKETDKLSKEKQSKNLESKTEEKAQSTEKKVSPKSNAKDNSKANNKVSKKPVQSKQSGFNNLFGKVQSKPKTSDNLKKDSDTVKGEKTEELQISKENTSKDKEDKTNETEKEKTKKRESSEKENKIVQPEVKSKSVSKSQIKETKSKSQKDSRGKKRNRSQESATTSKRKRIVVVDSSEDESDKSDEEEEEPMEIEEEPVKITRKRSPSPPAEKRQNGKKMVSKYVIKTYKDEDGYLVTKREQVYEAVSDNEEPEVVKTEEQNKPKPAETKIKKKQTNITNFFKKS